MNHRMLVLLVALIAASPAVVADEASPEELQPSPQRLGDRYLFELSVTETVEAGPDAPEGWQPEPRARFPGDTTLLVVVRGVERVTDAHAVARDAVAFRIEQYQDGEAVSVEECFMDPNGETGVRWDYLTNGPRVGYGRREGGAGGPLGQVFAPSDYHQNTTLVTGFGQSCDGRWSLAGHGFMEGYPVHESAVRPSGRFPRVEGASYSAPATPTESLGRRALDYVFDLALDPHAERNVTGTFRARVAEDLPVPVELELHQRVADAWEVRRVDATLRLTGFERGDGPYPADTGERRGRENPHASWRAQPRLSADVGLALPYPFPDAFTAVTEDPSTGLAAFLAEHPKAALVMATFDAEMRPPSALDYVHGMPDARETDGGWELCYLDGADVHCVATARSRAASGTPPLTENWQQDVAWGSPPQPSTEPRIVSADDLVHLVQGAGLDPANVRALEYTAFEHWPGEITVELRVSEVPLRVVPDTSGEGRAAQIDLTLGRLDRVMSSVQEVHEKGLAGQTLKPTGVPAPQEDVPPAALATGTTVAPPAAVPPAAAAAAALTAAVLIALALKYAAFPLFTRLRRDRLLDNPVRARIHDLVRSDPGIRLSEITDHAGIGKGATKHHLDKLTRHGLLVEVRVGGSVSYCSAGDVPPDAARREAVLRAPARRRVFDLYAEHPDLTLREAAQHLGVSAPSVHRARKALEAEGLLPTRGHG